MNWPQSHARRRRGPQAGRRRAASGGCSSGSLRGRVSCWSMHRDCSSRVLRRRRGPADPQRSGASRAPAHAIAGRHRRHARAAVRAADRRACATGRAASRRLARPDARQHRGDRAPVVVGGRVPNDDRRAERCTTANEIHIPVGRPVLLKLQSTDVIHSFWVPNLHGKKDLIPGTQTRALDPGRSRRASTAASARSSAATSTRTWRCCVIAEPPDELRALDRRAAPAGRASRTTDAQQRGRDVFLSATVRDVPQRSAARTAAARIGAGPHAPRRAALTLAAGTLPNTPATSPAGSPTRRASSRASACRRSRSPARTCRRSSAYLESLK